jgi:Prokaryotic cytochrome b561
MRPLRHDNAEIILRHRLPVRLWHWISVFAIVGLLFTGFCILNVHPRLYWGEVGNAYTPALVALDSNEPGGPRPTAHPAPAVLVVGKQRFDVTGRLGVVADAGNDGLYFLIANTPESWQFGAIGYKNAKYVDRIELVDRLDGLGKGRGGWWEDFDGAVWYSAQ